MLAGYCKRMMAMMHLSKCHAASTARNPKAKAVLLINIGYQL